LLASANPEASALLFTATPSSRAPRSAEEGVELVYDA
jgi:hypothetical protein